MPSTLCCRINIATSWTIGFLVSLHDLQTPWFGNHQYSAFSSLCRHCTVQRWNSTDAFQTVLLGRERLRSRLHQQIENKVNQDDIAPFHACAPCCFSIGGSLQDATLTEGPALSSARSGTIAATTNQGKHANDLCMKFAETLNPKPRIPDRSCSTGPTDHDLTYLPIVPIVVHFLLGGGGIKTTLILGS